MPEPVADAPMSELRSADCRVRMSATTRIVPADNLVGLVHGKVASRALHVALQLAAHLGQLGHGPRAIRGKSELGPRSGNADHGNAIGRANARPDERLGGAPRNQFIARGDVRLVEHEQVEVSSRGAAVRRDLRGQRPQRRLLVHARRLADVLEEQQRKRLPVFDDLEFFRPDVAHRPAVPIGYADVEAHQIHAGLEDRRLGGLRRHRDRRREQGRKEQPHFYRILTRCAFSGSPNIVHSCAATTRVSGVGETRSISSISRSDSALRPMAR